MCTNKLVEIIKKSKSRNDASLKYFGYTNQHTINKIIKCIDNYKINVSHWEKVEKFCLFCNNKISNHKKFCNTSCSAKFNKKYKKHSKETRKKISESIKNKSLKKDVKRKCKYCNVEFKVERLKYDRLSRSKYCSKKCSSKYKSDRGKETMKKRINNGEHKGWIKRSIISYPEKFFVNVLKNNNIEYEHNYPVNKKLLGIKTDSSNYFLDFYIKDKNIDLEIDGKQHKYRKEHDNYRDEILKKNGFNVYRIEWKSINTLNGKKYMKEEINKFINYYKSNN